MTNYELGIVFPLKDEAEIDRVVCYERPAKRYGSRDRPWARHFAMYFLCQVFTLVPKQMQEESEVLNGE